MKAYEIMNSIFEFSTGYIAPNTCDCLKIGNPEAEVTKIAVSMFATPDVVREAKERGAELLIVHEPSFYDHFDVKADEKIQNEKRAFIENAGLTLYRYHDHPHYTIPDIIDVGVVKALDLDADIKYLDYQDLVKFTMHTPITAVQLAKLIEEKLGIKHVRICGTRDIPSSKISLMCGTPGGVFEELQSDDCEILITGEACEWMLGEYARDAHQLGHNKTLLIIGHIGSERDGMKYTAQLLRNMYPQIETFYIECGEVYTYTD